MTKPISPLFITRCVIHSAWDEQQRVTYNKIMLQNLIYCKFLLTFRKWGDIIYKESFTDLREKGFSLKICASEGKRGVISDEEWKKSYGIPFGNHFIGFQYSVFFLRQ